MKKIFIVIIIFSLLFALAGCGGSKNSTNQTQPNSNNDANRIETYPYDKLPLTDDAVIESAITANQGGKIVFSTEKTFDETCVFYKNIMNNYDNYMEEEDEVNLYLFAKSDPYSFVVQVQSDDGAVKVTVIANQ